MEGVRGEQIFDDPASQAIRSVREESVSTIRRAIGDTVIRRRASSKRPDGSPLYYLKECIRVEVHIEQTDEEEEKFVTLRFEIAEKL